ncbi:hypothetical protein [Paraburkholderia hospita]|uniref:hypothetical protein n=1 Tax=Paraburkholderia hospita TaxID=169430 RepID=UPI000B342AC4|nr:hypothetical protein [Paraburkholderia hospita]OUL95699.1 hypothetical protein CA603_07765 [Paraburkholderia hospita]
MSTLATLFVVVLLLNLIPAFAPPTWMAMSWVGFNIPEGNPFVFAVVAASAATVGRLVLATFARALVRGRLMRDSDRQNIEAVEAWLKKRKKLTVGAFFLYALGPFPSNYLFIAYGLSGLPLGVIGAAFFAGRTISYSVWAHLGRLASSYIDLEFPFEGGYLSGYFIVSQLALLGSVYILMKLDWKMLIEQRKLKWRRTMRGREVGRRGHTAKH